VIGAVGFFRGIYGFYMKIHLITFGKKMLKISSGKLNRRKITEQPMTWDLKCFAVSVTHIG
jgi:hypothetical protein